MKQAMNYHIAIKYMKMIQSICRWVAEQCMWKIYIQIWKINRDIGLEIEKQLKSKKKYLKKMIFLS